MHLILTKPALPLALAVILGGESASGEMRIIVPNNYDIELSDQEKEELREAPARLVRNPSGPLLKAINDNTGEAWLVDQRGDPRSEYPLCVTIVYPTIAVNDHRTVRPSVACEGTYNPVVWDYCFESSDTYLDIPGHGQIHVGHASITVESAQAMLAFVDAAKIETPAGSSIVSRDVHNILYNSNVGLYHVIGDTPDDEYFSIKLRPIGEFGAMKFEISDWSCR